MRENNCLNAKQLLQVYYENMKIENIPTAGKYSKKAQIVINNAIGNPEFQPLGKIVDLECVNTPDHMVDKWMLESLGKRFQNVPLVGHFRLRGQPDLVTEFLYKGKKFRCVDDYKTGSTILTDTSFVQIDCYAVLDLLSHEPNVHGYMVRYLPMEHKKCLKKFNTLSDLYKFIDKVLVPAYHDWERGDDTKVPSTECRYCQLTCEHNYNKAKRRVVYGDF